MFALLWVEYAMNGLADVYIAASPEERERIAAGVEAVNARLRTDPSDEGESREGGGRITFPPLLAVGFHVSEDERVVQVRGVRRYGR